MWKIFFVNKNWLFDARVGCESLSNLADLIDFELNLEKKLDKFEGSFEQNELKEDYSNFFVSYFFEMWSHIYF